MCKQLAVVSGAPRFPTQRRLGCSSDTDITDATGSSYTLVAADEGNTIKVKVSFADDARK